MASIRRGYSDDFTLKNNSVGIGTSTGQEALDVVDGAVKGQDLKVTGISSFTAYEGFLRADHQIAENTTLSFDQGSSASLSGEIIVGTGQTVTINTVQDDPLGPELITNGNFDSDVSGWTAGTNTAVALDGGRIKITNSTTVYGSAYQDITVVPGETYVINVHYVGGTGSGNYHVGDAVTTNKYLSAASGKKAFTPESTIVRIVLNVGGNTSGHYVLFDSVTVKKENNVSDKTTRAGGSEIECLKVYNTFTPPSGGTNERPYAPKPGELYYNYDFKTIEFFDGYGWRQVDNTTSSGRSVWAGGYIDGNVRTKEMMLINISTLGNSTYFGDLNRNVGTDSQGVGSAVRGIFGGGYGVQTPGGSTGRLDDIDYITLASEGNGIDFGNLTVARNGFGAVSSSTRGIFAGGASNQGSPGATNSTNVMEYVEISTTGNALDFGDLVKERITSGGLVNNATRGIFGAGDDFHTPGWQGTALGQLDSINMSSKGNSVDFGNDAVSRIIGGGCSNEVRGCWGGGYISPLISSGDAARETGRAMTFITISSFGNAVEFGTLSCGARSYIGAASTKTRGIWTGGSSYPVHHNEIDYIQFASLGDTLDFGDLHRNKGYMNGSTSDSHGGLGGF